MWSFFLNLPSLENLSIYIVSVIRTFLWTPDYIETMYIDKFDYKGIQFWYEDIKLQNEKLKST